MYRVFKEFFSLAFAYRKVIVQALIEKDWLAFGHKFNDRYGFIAGDQREISPIFTQFIEATWQLYCQFPLAFQFNEKYLLNLHDNFTSCQYGTFIGNCEKDRMQLKCVDCETIIYIIFSVVLINFYK